MSGLLSGTPLLKVVQSHLGGHVKVDPLSYDHPKRAHTSARRKGPVSPESARLGKMRSRPNRCSSEPPCLWMIACRRQASHTNPSSVPQYVTVHSGQRIFVFEHLDIFARFWAQNNGPLELRSVAGNCARGWRLQTAPKMPKCAKHVQAC